MPNLYSKIALLFIAISLTAIALRPMAEGDAHATENPKIDFLGDPAFEKAVAYVVNNYCEVAKIPKSSSQKNLIVTCHFDK